MPSECDSLGDLSDEEESNEGDGGAEQNPVEKG